MAKGTVLVVDDDPGIVDLLDAVLTYEGHAVLAAVDGAALQVAHDQQPNVILLDIMMPGMDGVEVSQRLRVDAATAAIPTAGHVGAQPPAHDEQWDADQRPAPQAVHAGPSVRDGGSLDAGRLAAVRACDEAGMRVAASTGLMPAKDRYHDTVVRALHKDGWTILDEQVALFVPARRLWVDVRAIKEGHPAIILVEVKGFETGASPVAYLSDAVGQCIVYQGALAYPGLPDQLYLAVPTTALRRIVDEAIGWRTVQHAQGGLHVFDPVREEISEWRQYTTP